MIFERGHPDHPGWFYLLNFVQTLDRYLPGNDHISHPKGSWEDEFPAADWWDLYGYVNALEGKLMTKDLLLFQKTCTRESHHKKIP